MPVLKVSLTRKSLFNSTLRQSEIQAHVILLSCFASSCVWRAMCQSIAFGLEILVFLIGFQIQPVLTFLQVFTSALSGLIFYRIEQWIGCVLSGKSLFSLILRLPGSSDVQLSPFRFWNAKLSQVFNGFLKDASFGPSLNLYQRGNILNWRRRG